MTTILLTGFGPFPGAPVNPTGPLVRELVRTVRLPRVKMVAHVFETSYAAVDRELPELLVNHGPDILLMFGLATRTRLLRVEIVARNVVSVLPDVSGACLQRRTIVPGKPATMAMPAPTSALLKALREARVPATLSRDAGDYLCNYLCWRAADAVASQKGPRHAAFIHVPPIRRGAAAGLRLSAGDLTRAGGCLVATLAKAARR